MIVPEMAVWLAGKCCRKTCNFGPCSREEEDGFKRFGFDRFGPCNLDIISF
ncbi:hypothetical protein Hanom_Chr03g00239351 [Helianthus anomalus]